MTEGQGIVNKSNIITCSLIGLVLILFNVILFNQFNYSSEIDGLNQEIEMVRFQSREITPSMVVLADFIQLRNSKTPRVVAEEIAFQVYRKSEIHHVLPELIVGIIEKESLYNPFAISSQNARGLMQVLRGQDSKGKKVITDMKKIHNIGYNLDLGLKILNGKLKLTNGNLEKALGMYSGYANAFAGDVYRNMGRYLAYENKRRE